MSKNRPKLAPEKWCGAMQPKRVARRTKPRPCCKKKGHPGPHMDEQGHRWESH